MKLMKRDRENRKHRFRRVNSRYVSTVVEYHKKCFPYLTMLLCLPDERIAKICKEFNFCNDFLWADVSHKSKKYDNIDIGQRLQNLC